MSDKTPLERDLEQHELVRTPWKVRIFILLILAGLCLLGYHAYDLKNTLAERERELRELRDLCQDERNKLLDEVKILEERISSQQPSP